jgi:hypothetical protein
MLENHFVRKIFQIISWTLLDNPNNPMDIFSSDLEGDPCQPFSHGASILINGSK